MSLLGVLSIVVGAVLVFFALVQKKRPAFWTEWIDRESKINQLNAQLELCDRQMKTLHDGVIKRDKKILELNAHIASQAEEYMLLKLDCERKSALLTEYDNLGEALDSTRERLKTLKMIGAGV